MLRRNLRVVHSLEVLVQAFQTETDAEYREFPLASVDVAIICPLSMTWRYVEAIMGRM